jgi:DNA repair exonuclease SbcCD ATPase subunit
MIHSVEMINWRAYEKRIFHLEPGITFLMGPNGAGKTSVLEAICYGLTGEAAMFDSKTRPKLLRDPDHNATVNITFETDNKMYCVSRSQSPKAAANAELTRLLDGKSLAYNHSQCTRQISKLMGVSADFLRRIVYMAEGDVFRFINEPPGEALESQIRQVLGLTQLDQFTLALDKSQKQLKQRMEALQELSNDLNRLNIHTQTDLQERLNSGENTRSLLLEHLEDNKAQVIQIQATLEGNNRLQGFLAEIQNAQIQNHQKWSGFAETPLVEVFVSLENAIAKLSENRRQLEIQTAHLEGEKEAQHKILAILEPYENHFETFPCPVCQKPMTEPERHSILSDLRINDQKLNHEIDDLGQHHQRIRADLEDVQARFDILKELRNLIVHGNIPNIKPTSTIEQIKEIVSQDDQKRDYLKTLDQQGQEIQRRLSELQNQQAEYLAIKQRLAEFGFTQPEEVNDALVALEVRSLSIRSAAQASQQTLLTQRNTDMQSIYIQIARLWGAFTGEEEWQIALDGKGLPTLENEIGRKFDMHQLSGGEKTALLIMLHTIIAHNFSQSDFIMVDEPLEHLDPVNRRSLIRFLVQSYRRGMFKQAIVATFEESLIRKYLSEDGVKIVMV